MNSIFEPFVQVHSPRKSGGIGIGLALTKNLVEMHGGTVTVSPGPNNVGSEFVVRIPTRSQYISPGSVVKPALIQTPVEKLTLLVVDDNKSAADSLSKLLTLRGHRVESVYSGDEALAYLQDTSVDAVILDIGLPDMTGHDVATRLRARGFAGSLIALTGYGQAEDRRKSMESGFHFHLVKPVGLSNLEPVLDEVAMERRA